MIASDYIMFDLTPPPYVILLIWLKFDDGP